MPKNVNKLFEITSKSLGAKTFTTVAKETVPQNSMMKVTNLHCQLFSRYRRKSNTGLDILKSASSFIFKEGNKYIRLESQTSSY